MLWVGVVLRQFTNEASFVSEVSVESYLMRFGFHGVGGAICLLSLAERLATYCLSDSLELVPTDAVRSVQTSHPNVLLVMLYTTLPD